MSIKMIFGLPRSGKSTLLAKIAKRYHKQNVKVYSNFYIKDCYQLDFDDLGVHDYSDCVLLIDEASLVCDCRDWKKFSSNLVYFFTNHGHYNVEIWLCSQSYGDCDKKLRNLTEDMYYVKYLPFGFSMYRRINKGFKVDETIQEGYTLTGIPHIFFRPLYYKYFDSFVKRPLPPNDASPW